MRRCFLEFSARIGAADNALAELQTSASMMRSVVAACSSDAAGCSTAVQQLRLAVQQLQLTTDSLLLRSQQQVCTENILNELKDQCQQLRADLHCLGQQQLRLGQVELQQMQISDRLFATEQLQAQLREQQHELHQQVLNNLQTQRQHDRSDLQRLLDDKLEALQQRMAQVESHRDSWTTIERLVMSGSTGSSSGSGLQASRCHSAVNLAQSHQHESSIGDSFIALQASDVASAASDSQNSLPLRVVSVHVQFHQQDVMPVHLTARGQDADADFSVSISASVNQFFFDLQVTASALICFRVVIGHAVAGYCRKREQRRCSRRRRAASGFAKQGCF